MLDESSRLDLLILPPGEWDKSKHMVRRGLSTGHQRGTEGDRTRPPLTRVLCVSLVSSIQIPASAVRTMKVRRHSERVERLPAYQAAAL